MLTTTEDLESIKKKHMEIEDWSILITTGQLSIGFG
jgi:hypothetical protein